MTKTKAKAKSRNTGPGFVLLGRDLWDSPMFPSPKREPFCQRAAWGWLIMRARWADGDVNINGNRVHLKRGQLTASLSFLSEAWGWDKNKVRRVLDKWRKDRAIDTATDTGQLVVTLVNYDAFQTGATWNDTVGDTRPTRDQHATDTNKNKGTREQGKKDSSSSGDAPAREGLEGGGGGEATVPQDGTPDPKQRTARKVAPAAVAVAVAADDPEAHGFPPAPELSAPAGAAPPAPGAALAVLPGGGGGGEPVGPDPVQRPPELIDRATTRLAADLAEAWRNNVLTVWGKQFLPMPNRNDDAEALKWIRTAQDLGMVPADLLPFAKRIIDEVHQRKHLRGEGPPTTLSYATRSLLEALATLNVEPADLPRHRFSPGERPAVARGRRAVGESHAEKFMSRVMGKGS